MSFLTGLRESFRTTRFVFQLNLFPNSRGKTELNAKRFWPIILCITEGREDGSNGQKALSRIMSGNDASWEYAVTKVLYGYRGREDSEGGSLLELMYGKSPRMAQEDVKGTNM